MTAESMIVPPVDAHAGYHLRPVEVVLDPLHRPPPIPPGEPSAGFVGRPLRRNAIVHRSNRVVGEAVRGRRGGERREARANSPLGLVGIQTTISAGPRLALA